MMLILELCLLTASGYPVGWSLMKLVTAEEAMVASGKGRDLKVLGRFLIYVLVTFAISFALVCLVALDETATSDQVTIFGLGTLIAMSVPILRYRWQQWRKKKGD